MRPKESMVARNMSFSEILHRAFLSKDGNEDFTLILIKMAGFTEKPVRVSSTQVIEEMLRD